MSNCQCQLWAPGGKAPKGVSVAVCFRREDSLLWSFVSTLLASVLGVHLSPKQCV